MAGDAELYLGKARESLASARADLDAGRHNSAANRSYYAGFQAAVAILITVGIRARSGQWEHRFVISEFDKLVRRRRLLPSGLRGRLGRLFEARLIADYQPRNMRATEARNRLLDAIEIVREVVAGMAKGGQDGR